MGTEQECHEDIVQLFQIKLFIIINCILFSGSYRKKYIYSKNICYTSMFMSVATSFISETMNWRENVLKKKMLENIVLKN